MTFIQQQASVSCLYIRLTNSEQTVFGFVLAKLHNMSALVHAEFGKLQ